MEPLNIVIPAMNSPAANLFLGATEVAMRSTPLCTSCVIVSDYVVWSINSNIKGLLDNVPR